MLLKVILADGPPSELRIDALNTATPNFTGKPTVADGNLPNASWDIYYGMYLAAMLDSSRKGGNFLFFLNNEGSKQSVSIVQSCHM